MSEEIIFTKEELEKCGVHFLRQFGRKIGLKNASSPKKKELINEILEIQSGLKKPFFEVIAGRKPLKNTEKEFIKRMSEQNHILELKKQNEAIRLLYKSIKDILEIFSSCFAFEDKTIYDLLLSLAKKYQPLKEKTPNGFFFSLETFQELLKKSQSNIFESDE